MVVVLHMCTVVPLANRRESPSRPVASALPAPFSPRQDLQTACHHAAGDGGREGPAAGKGRRRGQAIGEFRKGGEASGRCGGEVAADRVRRWGRCGDGILVGEKTNGGRRKQKEEGGREGKRSWWTPLVTICC
jgi:hypothetical protein